MNPSNPPPDPGLSWADIATWAWVIGMSALGGLVSFYQKWKAGHVRAWNITELVGEMATSALVGFITYKLCLWKGCSPDLMPALVGITSHMGARALFKLEAVANAKFNLPPDTPAPASGGDHAA